MKLSIISKHSLATLFKIGKELAVSETLKEDLKRVDKIILHIPRNRELWKMVNLGWLIVLSIQLYTVQQSESRETVKSDSFRPK